MELTIDEKKFIEANASKVINLRDNRYYVKKVCGDSLTEVIVERLANIAGIKCAHYEVVKTDKDNFYLSKMVDEVGNFCTWRNYCCEVKGIFRPSSLYNMWYVLEKNEVDSKLLMPEIIRMYLFDILVMNTDRNIDNWGIVNNKDSQGLIIFDNELSFNYGVMYLSSKCEEENLKHYYNWPDSLVKYQKSNLEDLEYFICESSDEYLDILKELMDKLSIEVLEKIIDEVSEEYEVTNNKERILNIYKENLENISLLLESRGKNGKRILKNK